jgi:acetamidase/formamidase
MPRHHELHSSPETCHWGYFDAALKPALTVESGDTVTIHCLSGAQEILPKPPLEVLPEHREVHAKLTSKLGRHILTGPVAIAGAEPGDVLEVRIQAILPRVNWGWNVQRPLMGTLPEDFQTYRLLHIPIDRNAMTCAPPWGGTIPLAPFFGIMAVAPPPEWGSVSSVEPRKMGGNIDLKELQVGTTLLLPVWAKGALFSTGDGHGVQGDGEVNLTALETCLSGTFEFHLHKARELKLPRAVTPTHFITMAFDPDLDDAAKDALRAMIQLLGEVAQMKPEDAYAFCSLACDLRVTQTVDGHKGIHAMVLRERIQDILGGKAPPLPIGRPR